MSTSSDNRFAPITPDNHSGSVWIAALLCLIYSTLVLVVRGHLRWKMYGIDDWFAAAAVIMQLGQVAAVIVALKHGIGQSADMFSAAERSTGSQATFASQILFVIAACLAKCSTLLLMMRLFNLSGTRAFVDGKSRMLWWSCSCLLALMALYGVGSVIALSVDCSTLAFVGGVAPGQCPDQLLRWRLITALDVTTEALVVLISIFIVLPVQLSLELKLQVVLAFAFRLPVAVVSILHFHFVGNYVHSATPSLAIVPVLVCQQVELCWSLIAATIPNLKAFVKSFSSGFGLTIDLDANTRYGSRGYGAAGYELGSVRKTTATQERSNGSRNATVTDVEDQGAVMRHKRENSNARNEGSGNSIGSEDHIIRKDVQWSVEYEEGR